MMLRTRLLISIIAFVALVSFGTTNFRWLYVACWFNTDEDLEYFQDKCERAAKSGYNGIQLACHIEAWHKWDDGRKARLEKAKKIAAKNKLEIIPGLWSPGYGSFLGDDPNLCAATPYEGIWVRKGDKAVWQRSEDVKFENGNFEAPFENNKLAGWGFADGAGKFSFVDKDVRHGGAASYRFDCAPDHRHGHHRLMQKVALRPHRLYRLTFWVKTEDFGPVNSFNAYILNKGDKPGGSESWNGKVQQTGDWTKVTLAFNSWEETERNVYIGTWGGRNGRFWIDDVSIEEIGPSRCVIREGCPVKVEGADSGRPFHENKDYRPLKKMTKLTGGSDEPFEIDLPRGTSIKDGDRIRVKTYVPAIVRGGQCALCMSNPELDKYLARSARAVRDGLNPKRWFLSMDEIRAGGTCELCRKRNSDMARILGDFLRRECAAIRRVRPDAEIYVWADMFAPDHNAVGSYYACGGSFADSWKYVPKDVVMAVWNQNKCQEQMEFFSKHGFRTFGAAYYDVDTLDSTYKWVDLCRATPKCTGIMYTTWRKKYDLMEDFGRIASGRPFLLE